MIVDPRTLTLRTKIIGASIRDTRLFREKNLDECADAIGVSAETFEAYELGGTAPSLPELEGLAYFFDVPLENFLESRPAAGEYSPKSIPNMERLILLRQRMIGAILRQVRLEAAVTLEDLARYMQVDISQLEAYELGQQAIPLPHLEVLSGALNRSVREFQDQHGPVGEWETKQRAIQDFMEMPVDLQVFVSKPINRPYLELAIRLSEMSVDRLRSVAEGLLEITY